MLRSPSLRLPIAALTLVVSFAASAPVASAAESDGLYSFSHLAGPLGGHGNSDGTGPAARFTMPSGVAVDSAGNIFVADVGSARVRKITPAGAVTTVLTATSAHDAGILPNMKNLIFTGIAIDGQDNVYVSDRFNNLIFRLTPTGVLQLYTGKVASFILYRNTDGSLGEATWDEPCGMTVDAAGNIYVAEARNNVIRKITPQGVVSTYAGTTPQHNHPNGAGVTRTKWFRGSVDGPALSAQFAGPMAVAVDGMGNLFVADTGNHTIRRVAISGEVTTFAGLAGQAGSADGTGSAARFSSPNGVTVDSAGNVYVADSGNGTVRKITPGGVVSTLAGVAGDLRSADGTGNAARFVAPLGLVMDRSGRLLVGDGGFFDKRDRGGSVRRVTTDGAVTTIAGLPGAVGSTDGKGEAARFQAPADVAIDAAGNVFVADELNHAIRKITPDGTTTTFAGAAGVSGTADGAGSVARFNRPTGVAFDGNGVLYVADHDNHTIRKIMPDGTVSTFAGQPGVAGSANGTGNAATFHNPVSLAVDAAGNVYVGDGDYFPSGGDPARQYGTIRRITPSAEVSTFAGDPAIIPYEQTRFNFDGTGAGARFVNPTGLVFDAEGNLWVADFGKGIRKITPNAVVTTLPLVTANGTPLDPQPFYGIARDKQGNLVATDGNPGRTFSIGASGGFALLYRITTAGVVTALATRPGERGSADGAGTEAQFNHPKGIKSDAQGNLYIADSDNNAIRKGTLAGPPVITSQPQSQTVTAGGSVQFSVTATGDPAPTYQWQFNGAPFVGATNATLSFSNARASDAGNYAVVVTNSVGSVTSSSATLTVNAAPTTPPPGGGNGGGGGGGAPSWWFVGSLGAMAAFRALRICLRRAD
jgi:sugar lactone lactonase YvrE